MSASFLLTAFAGLFLAADAPKDDAAKKELEKLQGTWTVVSVRERNEVVDNPKDMKITISANEMAFHFGGKPIKNALNIDPTKKLKEINLTPPSARKGDPEQPGIYEMDGDTLKICLSGYGVTETRENKAPGSPVKRKVIVGDRPTSFDDKSGFTLVLKREKK